VDEQVRSRAIARRVGRVAGPAERCAELIGQRRLVLDD
jgi:hypothetical protein